MREIKFRAWDENSQEMIYEIGITPEGIPYSIPDNAEASDQFNYYPSCHKMQYTGLKDKNDREIYEGDVVKGINFNMTRPQRFIGEVEYSYNGFSVKGVKQYKGLRCELNMNFEVIGDVYRNPELLEAAE